MIGMQGVYYDSKSSRRLECTLQLDENQLVSLTGVDFSAVPLTSISISPRIGNSARFLTFPDGSVFETMENDAVDRLLHTHISPPGWFDIYHWERSRKVILLLSLLFVVCTYLTIDFGIPAFSGAFARLLPSSVSVQLADGVLESLDENLFAPSALPAQRRSDLNEQFEGFVRHMQDFDFQLQFRKGNHAGVNAFALPNGVVVLTDELVLLAENDFELQSVMLHEIGHVIHRHSLRKLIESSGLAALLIWLSGDIETASSWFVTLPYILIQSGYSRDIEWEADSYALEHMKMSGISPQYFADFMKKLNKKKKPDSDVQTTGKQDKGDGKANEEQKRKDGSNSWMDYFSTHPATVNRIKRFEDAAKQH